MSEKVAINIQLWRSEEDLQLYEDLRLASFQTRRPMTEIVKSGLRRELKAIERENKKD